MNYIDKTAISRDIELARAQKVDVIIACIHYWGEKYKQIPSNAQKGNGNVANQARCKPRNRVTSTRCSTLL